MVDDPDTRPITDERSLDHPGDPAAAGDEWVSLSHAAELTGSTEGWLLDRCRDGRLPNRPAPGHEHTGLAVPLSTARALVTCEITE